MFVQSSSLRFPTEAELKEQLARVRGRGLTRRCLPRNQWECFPSKYITIIQISH